MYYKAQEHHSKKIPQMLLGRCEFGKDDYSLNIVNLPHEEIELDHTVTEAFEEEATNEKTVKTKKKKVQDIDEQPSLF